MRLFRISNFIYAGLTALLAVLLFWTSQNVQHAENDLDEISSKLRAEQDSLHVLEAEWFYLTRPQRLEQLARDTLDMTAPAAGELSDDPGSVPKQVKPVLPGIKPAFYQVKTPVPQKKEVQPIVNDRARFDSLIGTLAEEGGEE